MQKVNHVVIYQEKHQDTLVENFAFIKYTPTPLPLRMRGTRHHGVYRVRTDPWGVTGQRTSS